MNEFTSVNASYNIDVDFQNYPQNGRINFEQTQHENGTPFFIQEKVVQDDKTNYFNAMKHTLQVSRLSSVYFCKENIDIIQNGIRAGVYEKTNKKYIIDKQDPDTLKVIMRSIYLQYSQHRENDITRQVQDLNQMVFDYCIPKIYSELMGYLKYKQDASTLAIPVDHPIHITTDKTVELNRFF